MLLPGAELSSGRPWSWEEGTWGRQTGLAQGWGRQLILPGHRDLLRESLVVEEIHGRSCVTETVQGMKEG